MLKRLFISLALAAVFILVCVTIEESKLKL